MDWSALAPFAFPGGATAMLGAVAWMIFTGRLVSSRWVDRMREDLLVWRDTAEKAITANEAHAKATRELAELLRPIVAAARRDTTT